MRAILFKIFLFIILAAGASKCNGNGGNNTNVVMTGFERVMTAAQIDSLCVADTLDADIEYWIKASFRDYETGQIVTKYSYIKELTDTTEILYIITYKDSTYTVLKRVVGVE